ncbi:unnamed protein product [Leptosia nina]|uniref:Uncharacterized protein n=1 Tax=Leptosia nina TaxID=320188 RepID=A0AAV1IZ45_9NEOP
MPGCVFFVLKRDLALQIYESMVLHFTLTKNMESQEEIETNNRRRLVENAIPSLIPNCIYSIGILSVKYVGT